MLKFLVLAFCVATALAAEQIGIPAISGGGNTEIKQYPYTVSLFVESAPREFCGGALVSSDWVLTAAHCVNLKRPYSIRAGSTSRVTGGDMVPVKKVILHPSFKPGFQDYDIALLQLNRTANHPQAIAVPLNEQYPPSVGQVATITGWGSSSQGVFPTILQKVEVSVMSNSDCKKILGENSYTERMFCAGTTGEGSVCKNDDGNPVVISGILAGLVSWGNNCRDGYPGVMTDVYSYRQWIRETADI